MDDLKTLNAMYAMSSGYRPYKADAAVINAITPPGGKWDATIKPALYAGLTDYAIKWNDGVVALVSPYGDFDSKAGEVLMALRAAPVMDAALRAIIALSARTDTTDNLPLIHKLAHAVMAHVEEPAPSRE